MKRFAAALALLVAACGARTGLSEGDDPRDASGTSDAGAPPSDEPPRPLSPLSTTTVRSRMPRFRWKNPPGAEHAALEVCRDRACTKLVYEALLFGETYRDTVHALDPGTYYWRLHPYDGKTGIGASTSATWELFVPRSASTVDSAWGSSLDLNGDGRADVVDEIVTADSDRIETRLGGAAGPSAPVRTFDVDSMLFYTRVMTSAGDLDGDGFAELVMSAETPRGDDLALVYPGGAADVSTTPTTITPADAWFSEYTHFAQSITFVGDVEGDGYADVALSMPPAKDNLGRVFVHSGSPTGIGSTPSLTLAGHDVPNGLFGVRTSSIDVDGDGRLELFVESKDPATTMVFALPSTRMLAEIDGSGFVGDFDGDGFGDFLVSTAAGAVEVHRGSLTGLLAARSLVVSTGGMARVVGDFNGDGCDDVVVSDRSSSSVWRGDPTRVLIAGPVLGFSTQLPSYTPSGAPVVTLGDVNGDGRADVATKGGDLESYAIRFGTDDAESVTVKPVLEVKAVAMASSQ